MMFSNSVVLKSQIEGIEGWLRFKNPIDIVATTSLSEVDQILSDLQAFVDKGYYVAGYLCYEAASAFDPQLKTKSLVNQPLCWFGVYKDYDILGALEKNAYQLINSGLSFKPFDEITANLSVDSYLSAIDEIKRQISLGNTYQVNYTFKFSAPYDGSPWALFSELESMQNGGYAAYIETENHIVCSASPELFFTLQQGVLHTKPMKGTIKKGASSEENEKNKHWLASSVKNRAENVMIVDMIRNDVGQFAHPGSVKVDELFTIEEYPTVYQMTSTVSARCDTKPVDALRKMFPCASITGAPKVKTMDIIRNIECDARGVYTGSIGFITPDNKAQFNVAIRTAVIDKKKSMLEYGVGGGIVWDSNALDEFRECHAKSAILKNLSKPNNLLETMLWDPESGVYLLGLHKDRMRRSSQALGYNFFDMYFDDAIHRLHLKQYENKMRVRVELWKDGEIRCEALPIKSMIGNLVGFAEIQHLKTQASNHKLTQRTLYNSALEAHPAFQDLILCCSNGYITESCFANVVIKIGNQFWTPPLTDGLVAGVFRKFLLNSQVIQERRIRQEELMNAKEIYLINSVRGWMKLKPESNNISYRVSSEFLFDLT